MMRPDYKTFKGTSCSIIHSAKGSTWNEHKYIKKVDGVYYYPNSYAGGRHLSNESDTEEDWEELIKSGNEEAINKQVNDMMTRYANAKSDDEKARIMEDIQKFSELQNFSNEHPIKNAFNKLKDFVVGKEGKVRSANDESSKSESENRSWIDSVKDVVVGKPGEVRTGSDRVKEEVEGKSWFDKIKDVVIGKSGKVKTTSSPSKIVIHSAKGSEWEEHKYIKRIDGTYYYPDSYEGGRHLPEGSGGGESTDEEPPSTDNLSEADIEALAREVIRGNFGNGKQRTELLGDAYETVQRRVNELMKGSAGSKKTSEATPEAIQKVEEAAKKVSSGTKTKETKSSGHSGVDMERVQSVYRNKDKK